MTEQLTPDIDPSPWEPEMDPTRLKAGLKLIEELGEGVSAAARVLMQGIDEVEPVTLKPNRQWFQEELADILANMDINIQTFMLDDDFIQQRRQDKRGYITRWLDGLTRPVDDSIPPPQLMLRIERTILGGGANAIWSDGVVTEVTIDEAFNNNLNTAEKMARFAYKKRFMENEN